MKRLVIIAAMLVAPLTIPAQDLLVEYGNSSELASVSRIYIYTGMDLKAHDEIVKAFKKYDKNGILEVVSQQEDADITLVYAQDWYSTGTYSQLNRNIVTGQPTGVITSKRGANVGAGAAVTFDAAKNSVRLIWQFSGSQGNRLQKSPEKKFAKRFIEAVQNARDSREE